MTQSAEFFPSLWILRNPLDISSPRVTRRANRALQLHTRNATVCPAFPWLFRKLHDHGDAASRITAKFNHIPIPQIENRVRSVGVSIMLNAFASRSTYRGAMQLALRRYTAFHCTPIGRIEVYDCVMLRLTKRRSGGDFRDFKSATLSGRRGGKG